MKKYIECSYYSMGNLFCKTKNCNFTKVSNVAQYKNADWSGLLMIIQNLTVDEAQNIAFKNKDIDFFFYVKGTSLYLEGVKKYFQHGDVAFFHGQPWWGEANGLCDGYVKKEYSIL